MSDVFNVNVAYDKASYNAGETMTVNLTGSDAVTTTSQSPSGSLTVTITNPADGASQTFTVTGVPINLTTTTNQAVKITAITDSSGRTWSIAGNGLSATAIA